MSAHPMPARQCVVSYSTREEALERFSTLCQGLDDCLLVSHISADIPPNTALQQINFKALQHQLGNTYEAIFLDLSGGLHLTALSILAGTLRGGGLLVLHLGADWLAREDCELARFLPWPLTSEQVTSHYKTLFWHALHAPESPFTRVWPSLLTPYHLTQTTLTPAQQHFVTQVLAQCSGTHILLAARGRGKSYALAELLYQGQQQGLRCVCTASSPHNLSTLTEHYQAVAQSPAPFVAPDALLQAEQHYDVLVVDEAASLPLPMLEAMLEKAQCLVFSSTDYGYEGSGRGFGIRFRQQLKAAKRPCQEHHLTSPLRWGENDPLEHWLDQLLFQEYQAGPLLEQQPSYVTGAQWQQLPQLLDQAFALLVNAHYQTTPENKRWLVDDPSVITFCHYQDDRLVGVALVSVEGELPDDLAEQVMQGKRRPRGHLLPQSLLAHEGIAEAGQYRYWRISRIAIAADYQRQGLGSQLLKRIAQQAKAQGVDFVCTSFAATTEVVQFWQHNQFTAVRLGTAQDQASGSYSLMMLKGLNDHSKALTQQWSQYFAEDWLSTLALRLRDLSEPLVIAISHTLAMGENPHMAQLRAKDVSDLTLFCHQHRPYDSIRAPLLRLVLSGLAKQSFSPAHADALLLLGCGLNQVSEKDAHQLGFSGKKAFYQHLKSVIASTLSQLK
ncbi:tRNA(Met) cytidine acetyltransferase TmcA [Marinomonas aquimarina]|uniref:tRNA(Met) cytidine acetyltransferase TmcA n=1 Tax=Marinomonas aquimarina TaxID=295068 RepID=A0A1A8T7G4_9GAMM|nr:GNAT family N-acetyltransferase [Marinomonas aquimarina]SBS28196.1 tRNA(Met) cytidine acetyltransferase TmcA [Marinomonas aquimarina]